MARPRSSEPTDGELEILKLLWERGPSELGPICTGLRKHREVATTTVATMLKVLLEKRLVHRERGRRGYVWTAAISERDARRGLLGKLVDGVFGGSVRGLVAHVIEDGKLDPEDRDEIRRLLEAYDVDEDAGGSR